MPVKNFLKEHLIPEIILFALGMLIATAAFIVTANPITTNGVREKLTRIATDAIKTERLSSKFSHASMDSFSFQKIGLDATESVVSYGTLFDKEHVAIARWVGIFEPSEQRWIDKLVGRNGFFELKRLAVIDINNRDELIAKQIEAKDLDGDGVYEFIIKLESEWADSRSSGFLLVKRTKSGGWRLDGLPNMAKSINQSIDGKISEIASFHAIGEPLLFFDYTKNKQKRKRSNFNVSNADVYQDEYVARSKDGDEPVFYLLRNGGYYDFIDHPVRKTSDIAVVAFIADDGPIMGRHHGALTVYSIAGSEALSRDINWNWGYSMLSSAPLAVDEIDLDSIIKAGVEAHVIGNMMVWYTAFERKSVRH
ncbi:hypothetical protein D9M68_405310 [compost metagenome]